MKTTLAHRRPRVFMTLIVVLFSLLVAVSPASAASAQVEGDEPPPPALTEPPPGDVPADPLVTPDPEDAVPTEEPAEVVEPAQTACEPYEAGDVYDDPEAPAPTAVVCTTALTGGQFNVLVFGLGLLILLVAMHVVGSWRHGRNA